MKTDIMMGRSRNGRVCVEQGLKERWLKWPENQPMKTIGFVPRCDRIAQGCGSSYSLVKASALWMISSSEAKVSASIMLAHIT